jgi:cell division protein FtsB
MNKSLALKNKLYLFLSLVFVFLIFIYLVYFLIDPEKGIISYYKLKNKQLIYKTRLNELKIKNDLFIDRTARLQPNTIDLDFLEEQLRLKIGYIAENEILIKVEE